MRREINISVAFATVCLLSFTPSVAACTFDESALVRALRARAAIQSGTVTYSVEEDLPIPPEINLPSRRETFYESRFGGITASRANRGDHEGVVIRREDGAPSPGPRGTSERRSLFDGAQYWTLTKDTTQAETYPLGGVITTSPDIRQLGVLPEPYRSLDDAELWLKGKSYQESKEGGLIVAAVQSEGGVTRRWWIDPDRDYAIVRMQIVDTNGPLYEMKLNLTESDGVWFPTLVEEDWLDRGKPGAPERVTRVQTAAFNQPDQPLQLRPADIGIEPGMIVIEYDEQRRPKGGGRWDGERIISTEEFARKLETGEVKYGPSVLASYARHDAAVRAGAKAPDTGVIEKMPLRQRLAIGPLSKWEKYTADFIQRFQLNEDQSQRAVNFLGDCQKRADDLLDRSAEQIAGFEKRLGELSRVAVKDRTETERAIQADIKALEDRIDAIFETHLKPRLEQLPTAAQRKAAPGPTSAPANRR